jgi:hypothetical protein
LAIDSKNCTIFGVHHTYEYRDTDLAEKGKIQIFSLLDKIKPDLIAIEQGYHDQLLEEFDGNPANYNERKRVQDEHWAAIWANNKGIKIILTDLEETLIKGTNKESCCLERENAIANDILKYLKNGHNNIVLFCGKDHANSVKDKILEYTKAEIVYMDDMTVINT